jgi:hypothetical protein
MRSSKATPRARDRLADQDEAEPIAPPPVLPDHPARQRILAVFANVGGSLRARDLREALDLPIASKSTEKIRSKVFSDRSAIPAAPQLPR